MATLERLVDALGASLDLQLRWQGERLDRLLDAAHAALVERVVRLLRARGWATEVEASFAIRGERGSIDILAWHPATTALLVVEVKSVVADVQSTISTLDRKRRLAPLVARDRGWPTQSASRLLVVADGRTARRRVAEHEAMFRVAFPDRGLAVHAWTRRPSGRISGLIFMPNARQTAVRQRVRPRTRACDHVPRSDEDHTEGKPALHPG